MGRDIEDDGNLEYYEDGEVASWSDVLYYCYHHIRNEFVTVIIHFILFLGFSYTFFAGVILLGESIQIIAGCDAINLIENGSNPLSAVMAGLLLGILFQSSYIVNNGIILAAISRGLSVEYGIYLAMGSSIGSTITSSIIALFHINDRNMLERAVAGASVNTLYYVLATITFFPIERGTGVLRKLADSIAPTTTDMEYEWRGLFDKIISPVTNLLIIPNTALIEDLVEGNIQSCGSAYPISCEGSESFSTCSTGLIACNSNRDTCPILFNASSSLKKDQLLGVLGVFVSVGLMILSLTVLVKMVNRLLINHPVEVIAKLTTHNQYAIMFVGCGSGMLLGNTSTSESALMPFVATGILEIEQMFPWCIGSNLGCAVTNLLVAWTVGNRDYMLVALATLFFNVFGTILYYPIQYLRQFSLHGALVIGIMTRTWPVISLLYFAFTFVAIPFLFSRLGEMISSEKKSVMGIGWFVLVGLGLLILYIMYNWFYLQGRERFVAFFEDSTMDTGGAKYRGKPGNSVGDASYYDDEYSEDGSDISSIGFGEVGGGPRKKNSKNTLVEVMRPKAVTPPKARKRLIKNYGETKADNCGCCADNVLM